jgi:hypothetical protein
MEALPTGKKERFIALYNDPESATFGNAYKSAITAGYTDSYARTITVKDQEWFKKHCRHGELMELAEDNLKKYLTIETDDPKLMKIQQDTAKFVTETLGKREYSRRSELISNTDRKQYNPSTKLIVEKILDDFLQPKETRVRLEQTLN